MTTSTLPALLVGTCHSTVAFRSKRIMIQLQVAKLPRTRSGHATYRTLCRLRETAHNMARCATMNAAIAAARAAQA